MADDPDAVGYGRPPKSGQFKKGVSGNPQGRPRKAKRPDLLRTVVYQPSRSLALREAHRQQRVTIDGVSQSLPVLEIGQRAIAKKAMQGSRLHFKLMLDQTMAEEARFAAIEKEHCGWMRELKAEGERALARAYAQGLPEPVILPHPDDIQLGPGLYEVRILGPETEAELALAQANQLAVKILLYRSERAQLKGIDTEISHRAHKACGMMVLAHMFNANLPARFKLSEGQMRDAMINAKPLKLKDLEREIAAMIAEWQSLHAKCPPMTPEVEKAVAKLKRSWNLA